jgi:hypothetical protein
MEVRGDGLVEAMATGKVSRLGFNLSRPAATGGRRRLGAAGVSSRAADGRWRDQSGWSHHYDDDGWDRAIDLLRNP